MPRNLRAVTIVLALAATAVSVPAQSVAVDQQEEVLQERWMAVYLQGQKAGHAHMRTLQKELRGETVFLSTTREVLSLARGNTKVDISVTDKVLENQSGRVIAFKQEIDQGPAKMVTRGRVKGDKMVLQTQAFGGQTQSRTVEAPKGLGPWAVQRISRGRGYAPGTSYRVHVFSSHAPTKDTVASVRVGEKEPVQLFEVTKWLHPVEVEISILPGFRIVEWCDDQGEVWRARMKTAMFDIELRRVSKHAALEPSDPVEVMVKGAILPDRPIPRPRQLQRLRLLLSPVHPEESLPELHSDANQQVTKVDGALDVTICAASADPDRSYRLPYEGEEYARLLQPTPWLELDEPVIAQMSEEAVGGETDAVRAAHKIEAYVKGSIRQKNLGMGFATAAETARQKAGDCTEHAVLVAALARAVGMPARVVCGLAYGGPIAGETQRKFFYHMWAEVYVGQWLPLDAALGGHDATHIAITRSSLESTGDLTEMTGDILMFLGNTEIEILKVGK